MCAAADALTRPDDGSDALLGGNPSVQPQSETEPPVSPFGSPAWHADPTGRHHLRYHNSGAWTGWVADGDRRSWDPVAPRFNVRALTGFWAQPGARTGGGLVMLAVCGSMALAIAGTMGWENSTWGEALVGFAAVVTTLGGLLLWPGLVLLTRAALVPGPLTPHERTKALVAVLIGDLVAVLTLLAYLTQMLPV